MSTGLAVLLALVALGAYVRVWRARRALEGVAAASGSQLALFVGGLLVAVAALGEPLDSLADDSLLVMHAVQLLLLTTIAPPLLVAGIPTTFVSGLRVGVVRWLSNPLWCLLVFVTVLWAWHVPPLFDAASADAALRALQHVSFLAAGVVLAWPLAGPLPGVPRRLTGLRQLVYLAAGELAVGVLGIWLAWYPTLVYDGYGTGAWGLSATADQSLAGVVLLVVAEPLVVIEVAIVFMSILSRSQDDPGEEHVSHPSPR